MATAQLVRPNPVLQRGLESVDIRRTAVGTETMSIVGSVHATAVFLFVLVVTAAIGWQVESAPLTIGSAIVALMLGIYTSFKPMHAQYTGLGYAAFEGIFVGAISQSFEQSYPGIVFQAAGLTIAILAALLGLYRSGKIRVTENFKLGVSAAVGGVFLFYMASLVVSLFGVTMPLVSSNSVYGIGFSVFVVALASATLVVDFDYIEQGAERGLPRQMNWYAAFGLMVALIWLYLELLRLLAKLQSRR